MDYNDYFSGRLDKLHESGQYRHFSDIERQVGHFPVAYDHSSKKHITLWCSNDYLGMGQSDVVINAMAETARKMGAGAGGTRNISGTNHAIIRLEETLSRLYGHGKRALTFPSGYTANSTAISTIASNIPGCVVFSDSHNHASMIEGVRFSRAQKHIFRHNDTTHLEELLAAEARDVPKIIVFESVYSMDGDIAPIREIIRLAKEYNALTYIDEVHAVGLYGPRGLGVCEQLGVIADIDIIQGTFAKGYGVCGGFIVAGEETVDFVRSFGSGFIFSTATPPPLAAAARASVEHVAGNAALRRKLHDNVTILRDMLRSVGVDVMDCSQSSHIIPVMVGDAFACAEISHILREEYDIFVQHINYPTVPVGTERLRITPTPLHTQEMMERLTRALRDIMSRRYRKAA